MKIFTQTIAETISFAINLYLSKKAEKREKKLGENFDLDLINVGSERKRKVVMKPKKLGPKSD